VSAVLFIFSILWFYYLKKASLKEFYRVLEKGRYARELFKAEYQHRKNWVQLTKGFIPLIVVCGNLFGQGERSGE
jgi:ubiquinone/menaquinone biosynthesis C-methylase UbiE